MVFTRSDESMRPPIYGNSLALGKEITEIVAGITSCEAMARIAAQVKAAATAVTKAELQSHSNVARPAVFAGEVSRTYRNVKNNGGASQVGCQEGQTSDGGVQDRQEGGQGRGREGEEGPGRRGGGREGHTQDASIVARRVPERVTRTRSGG